MDTPHSSSCTPPRTRLRGKTSSVHPTTPRSLPSSFFKYALPSAASFAFTSSFGSSGSPQSPAHHREGLSHELARLYKDLQAACDDGNVERVEEILNCASGVNPNDRILRGKPPLYWAVTRGRLAVCKLLIEKYDCNPHYVTENGTTLFHAACSRGHVEIAKYLFTTHNLEPTTPRKDGTTPIMAACFYGNLAILKYLVEDLRCDINLPESCADGTLLHIACTNDQISIARYLISEYQLDPSTPRVYGETPVHIASSQGHLSLVKYLSEELGCSLAVRDEAGDTPLHLSARNDRSDVVSYLLERGCETDVTNNSGHTPLMVACRCGKRDTVKLLLEVGKADPNCQSHTNESPLQCTRDKAIIKELVRHGANTTNFLSNVLEYHRKLLPLKTLVRMFVVGHPMAGKSTLVKALQELTGGIRIFSKKKVTGVTPMTAGIVPTEFESPDLGRVLLFDFAGQNEYYASHAALLEASKTSAPLFILVVNLMEKDKEIKFHIHFWLSFINNHHVPGSSVTHIAVIGSHKDKLHKEFPLLYTKKIAVVESIVQNAVREYTSLRMVGFFALDCRKPHKHVKLRNKLRESCTELRSDSEVDGCCHILSAFLCERFEGKMTCTMETLIQEVKESDLALPCTSERMCELVEALSERQNILFLRNNVCLNRSWIVLEVDTLLMKINGSIFAPENFKEHCLLTNSGTGVLTWTHLKKTFLELSLNPELVVAFLKKLEFCDEIMDGDVLSLIQQEATPERSQSPNIFSSDIERDFINAPGRSVTAPGRYYRSSNSSVSIFSTFLCYDDTTSHISSQPQSHANGTGPTNMTTQRRGSAWSANVLLAPPPRSDRLPLSGSRSNPDFEQNGSQAPLHGRLSKSCNQLVFERYFFFPGLLSHERPSDLKIWNMDDSFHFHTGWCMQVSLVNQFFTPRLLHILLLRIAFGFAIAKKCCGAQNKGMGGRQCTVWKNGIRWLDLDGIETVVEMMEQNRAVVLLMRGKIGSDLKCVSLRSRLVHLILDVKRKFCPNLRVTEYLLDPKELSNQSYPFATQTLDSFSLYEMSTVVTSIVERKEWVCDAKGISLCNLTNLLYFEPYTNLGEQLLGKLFGEESKEIIGEQLYEFLHEYAQAHFTRGAELSVILKISKSPFSSVSMLSCSYGSLNGLMTNGTCHPPCIYASQQGT